MNIDTANMQSVDDKQRIATAVEKAIKINNG